MRIRMSSPAGLLSIAAAALLAACSDQSPVAPTSASAPSLARTGAPPTSPRYIVLFKEQALRNGAMTQAAATDLTAHVTALGGRVERLLGAIGVATVSGLSSAGVEALQARADIEGVAPDRTVQWIPPQPRTFESGLRLQSNQRGAQFFDEQWNLRKIQAPAAWDHSRQGRGARVAILDTGGDPRHIDLRGKYDPACSASFVPTESALTDFVFHGTAVGSIVSSNGVGTASVAPDAKLCAVKVFDRNSNGTFDQLLSAIVFANVSGANVINMSLGAYFSRNDPGARPLINALQRAISFAFNHGTVVVASAGNGNAQGIGINLHTDAPDMIEAPCEIEPTICVGATGPRRQRLFDRRATYSNFGFQPVDIMAPGGNFVSEKFLNDLILSPCSSLASENLGFDCTGGRHYLLWDGTSAAAPHVAGEAAVIWSDGIHNPAQIRNCIYSSADHTLGTKTNPDPQFGHGRINVGRAARCG